MNRVTARHLPVVLLAALALAGCSSATNDQASQETTTTTSETVPDTATTPPLRPECEDVADKGRTLLAEVGKLTTRDATVADVQAAAAALSDAFDDAKAALGPDAQAQLAQASLALQQVQDALKAQPVDTAALRRAASDLVAAAGDAATLCSPGSATNTTDTGTDTESTETTKATTTETTTETTTP